MEHAIVNFIQLDVGTALQIIMLGFIGGVLSGFIGSGGAFFYDTWNDESWCSWGYSSCQ